MANSSLIFNKDFIKQKLTSLDSPDRISFKEDNFINSAIIILIIPYKNKPYDIILIRRTHRIDDKYSGEMSFPGGKFDIN